jgi:hypothetical protein
VSVFHIRTAAIATTAMILSAISGCTGDNLSINTLQLSGEVAPFPSDYRTVSIGAVAGRPLADGKTLQVSHPQTIVGNTAFDPKRWYVCIRGIKAPSALPVKSKPLWQSVEDAVAPPTTNGIYEVIIILDSDASTSILEAFDAGLCKDVTYEPLSPSA